eukprot:GGOE01056716.1.p1 GENE.GGOE01056716.1~~GGOE01056716.1.p1  ORF type:complete len:281 (-),score=47.64 GGOE01056716.1:162-1004(-)
MNLAAQPDHCLDSPAELRKTNGRFPLPTAEAEPRAEDDLDGFVMLHSPIIGLQEFSSSTATGEPTPLPHSRCQHSVESEYVVPIDVNAFVQDVERAFTSKRAPKVGDREAGWPRIWHQFIIDLPRQHLTVNGIHFTNPDAVYAELQSYLEEEDCQLVVMLCQQCTLALPFEILSKLHADYGKGIYVGEVQGHPTAGSMLQPQRMAVSIALQLPPQQCGGFPQQAGCIVSLTKVFRVFRVDDAADAVTVSTLQATLEFDILRDPNVLLNWKWQRPCPQCVF